MKYILFIVLFCLANIAYGQCVVYTCDNTGVFGFGYNPDNTTLCTVQECAAIAAKECKEKGGNSCKLQFDSNRPGWWGFIAGIDEDGTTTFIAVNGRISQSEAEADARQKYMEKGGTRPDDIKVYTWCVTTKQVTKPGNPAGARETEFTTGFTGNGRFYLLLSYSYLLDRLYNEGNSGAHFTPGPIFVVTPRPRI